MPYSGRSIGLLLGLILLQGLQIFCAALPTHKVRDESDAKYGATSLLPEMEEEEFLDENRSPDSETQKKSHLISHLVHIPPKAGRGSRSTQSTEAEAAEAAAAALQPPMNDVSVDDITDPVEGAAAEETLERPAAEAKPEPAAAPVGGGSVRADATGGGGGGGLSGLIPQGLPSMPGLPFGQGATGGAAGNQQLPTLFLGGFQVMRMPMPSASDMLGMMQAFPSLMQGAPNLMQGLQGLQLPGMGAAAG